MKSLFILFFLLCGLGAHAHGVDSTFAVPAPQTLYASLTAESLNSLTTDYKQTKYWEKRRKLLIGGGFCVGVGVVGAAVGAIAIGLSDIYADGDKGGAAAAFFAPASALVAGGVTMFVFAHRNKRRAKRAVGLSLNVSPVEVRRPDGARSQQPALGICIRF